MISILTESTFDFSYKVYLFFKDIYKKYILKRPNLAYSGHFAVTRSMIEGLTQLNETFNYNPRKIKDLHPHVHVLGGINTLKSAIKLKKQGKIKRLTAGPNIVILSDDFNHIISSKEIDFFMANSNWIVEAYLVDNPLLKNKIDFFPSGVNLDFWNIVKKANTHKKVGFYYKRPEVDMYENCKKICQNLGYEVQEIFHGKYNLDDFKCFLSEIKFVVYFVEQESQGIALAEIWATNTPTIVWNPGVWIYKNRKHKSTSAPYLSEETGIFFRNEMEFKNVISSLSINQFMPQKWVKNNMTDKICTQNFLDRVK